MVLHIIMQELLPAIETQLCLDVSLTRQPHLEEMYSMLAYHMGWEDEGAGQEAGGKRIRPLIVLLVTQASGGKWETALPAASAIELVHNFSLIHDDIQDESPLRRGRTTLWKRCGVAQAINAGDAMFSLAQIALLRLSPEVPGDGIIKAAKIFQETCLALTQGQYLDLSYETRGDLSIEAYWPMVSGKTAAMVAASAQIGAIIAGAGSLICDAYRRFGRYLGLAFQAQDDLLGIWGDAALTGKSAQSDLLSGKLSLPVLYGLSLEGLFAERWSRGPLTAGEIPEITEQLEREGARSCTQSKADELTGKALSALEDANPQDEAGQALFELTDMLLKRNK